MTRGNGTDGGGTSTNGTAGEPKRKGGRSAIRNAVKGARLVKVAEVPKVAEVLSRAEQDAPQPLDDATHPQVFGFEWRPDGLYRVPGGEKFPFRVCGPFEVLAESRPEGGDEWGLLLRWNDRDTRKHEWLMQRRLLAGEAIEVRARFAACGLDVGAHQGARQALVEFLSSVKVPLRVRTVPRTGWYRPPAGGAAFVLPGRTIGSAAGEVVRLDLDPAPTVYRERGTLAGWQAEVATRCIGNTRLLFGVSCAFAGPLLPLAEDEGGGINFRGASSKGKTTVIDAAASAWGAPSKTGPDAFTRTWRNTDNALESTAAAHNHVVLPLDEMGQADPATLGNSLYMLANGLGKGRNRPGGGNRPMVSFLALVLSSSEESVERQMEQTNRRAKAGQAIRLLDIPAEVPGGHGVFEDLHGAPGGSAFAQALRAGMVAHHGTAGPAFLEWLAAELVRVPDFVAQSLLPVVASWCRAEVRPGADGQVHRAARRFATIALAGELATAAGVTGWSEGEASDAAAKVFRAWQDERGGTGSREDHHLFAAFRKFLALHGSARFEVAGEKQEETPETKTISRAGWRWRKDEASKDESGAILTAVRWVYGIAPEVFDAEIAQPLGAEGREARARLGKAGLIEGEVVGVEQRWTLKPRRIPGVGRPRLVVATAAAIEGGGPGD